jgi:signal transduction histidine kinase
LPHSFKALGMRTSFGLQISFILSPLLLFSTGCFSQDPYVLRDTSVVSRLDPYVEVFVDSSYTISIDQITRPGFQHNFKASGSNLTFGYLREPLWLKIKTRAANPHTYWYLEIPAPFLEFVDFYQWSKDSTWHHAMAGYYRKQSIRAVSHTSHVLPLEFNTDSVSTVYVKISGLSPKTFPVFVIEKEKFNDQVRLSDLGYGIFFGILIVMFFYNFFIYLILKQTNYLLYIGTIVCTFLIFSSASGYAGKFLWPEDPSLNFYAGRLSLGVIAVMLSVFTIRFLEVRQYSKIMYYVLLSLIPLALLAILLVITNTLSSAGNTLISVSTIAYMATGIVCRIKGNKTATFFIAAWTIYLIGGLLLTLRNSGVLDFNFWTTHFVEIGAAAETIIIALALGDRYRRYKKEKEEVQLLALKIQQEATGELEIKVKERTEQLSKTNEELLAILETNKQQTQIIENKNAELDSFFYRISHDLKGPITSLLGLSYLAKREIKDKRAHEYFEKQHQQVERLENIITGLIKLTRLNHTNLQKEKIDFNKMIDECILSFNGLDNFRSLTFKKDIQPGVEFYSEWTLMNAILQNLIENAIKYARDQSPFVRVIVRMESGWIVIEVEDNGQGISEEDQPRIFEMFYRATQDAYGSGLGLYILKRSVDRLKGTVEIRSEVGVGSTFIVKLPAI